jgi:hypothetical protein
MCRQLNEYCYFLDSTEPIPTPTPIEIEQPVSIVSASEITILPKRRERKPKEKHFVCPMEDCINRCRGRHDENHCYGFSRFSHSCSHHCGPLPIHCSSFTQRCVVGIFRYLRSLLTRISECVSGVLAVGNMSIIHFRRDTC